MTTNKLERIIVGDDQIDFARQVFPYIPGADVEYVARPDELVRRAKSGDYSVIITDLNYTSGGEEGFSVLEELSDVPGRKILWTGNADDPGIRERGQALGAEVLDKDEISSLVGQVVSKAPLKEDGKILVYASKGIEGVMKHMLSTLELPVNVSSDLRKELETGEYGLVIDTSTARSGTRGGTVAHDMKYIRLPLVPRVVEVRQWKTVVSDIYKIAAQYTKK